MYSLSEGSVFFYDPAATGELFQVKCGLYAKTVLTDRVPCVELNGVHIISDNSSACYKALRGAKNLCLKDGIMRLRHRLL